MNYPLISEYVEAIKSAEDNFKELSYLRPVLGDDGLPVMTSGNFAVVFKMKDEQGGKFYAVKCFTKEQEGRAEAYREIAKELNNVTSSYIVSIRYLEKELFVDTDQTTETEFPVLLMDWVDGKNLDKYLRENIEDKYALEMLAYRFSLLAKWLVSQPFAHGDLKPDNIIVREDGALILVDYDGMYVPAMKGQRARELGSPDYRHPLRTEDDFDEHIDDFSLSSLLLSLKVISINPLLLDEFGSDNHLLMSSSDYSNINESYFIRRLLYMMPLKEVSDTFHLFMSSLICFKSSGITKDIMHLNYELSLPRMVYESKVLQQDNVDYIKDEWVRYSKDGKKLISGGGMPSYIIPHGTETICDYAFSGREFGVWNDLESLTIPSSVKKIGLNPFSYCGVNLICNSPYFKVEDDALFTSDMKLLIAYIGIEKEYKVPEGVEIIGDEAFAGRYDLKKIQLPSSLKIIGNYSFSNCINLQHIIIPEGLKMIGNSAFHKCYNLWDIKLPNSLLSIGNFTFYNCAALSYLTIPSSVVSIGANPFLDDSHLIIKSESYSYVVEDNTLYNKDKTYLISGLSHSNSYYLPKTVTHIGKSAFWFMNCPCRNIFIHDKVKFVGENAFETGVDYTKLFVPKGRASWIRTFLGVGFGAALSIIEQE